MHSLNTMKWAYLLLGAMVFVILAGALAVFNEDHAPADGLLDNNEHTMSLTLTSPAFENGGLIPFRYTCDGDNISPELHIQNRPEGTVSYVLVMNDPDIPDSVKQARGIEKFDHWTLYNIPDYTNVISEGMHVGDEGLTSRDTVGYTGPCPPDREHRYIFRLYALSDMLDFRETPTLDEVERAAKSVMIEEATLIGRYDRLK